MWCGLVRKDGDGDDDRGVVGQQMLKADKKDAKKEAWWRWRPVLALYAMQWQDRGSLADQQTQSWLEGGQSNNNNNNSTTTHPPQGFCEIWEHER